MSQIYDPPGDYNAGLDFDYEVWTQNTRITLTTVPWGNSYENWFRPESIDELNDYIDQQPNTNVSITNASYARINDNISINIPLHRAMNYNYVRVWNPAQPVPGDDSPRYYYYFILGVTHETPNTTMLSVELDVMQTFGYDIELGTCFINQSHMAIAAENSFDQYGRTWLTQPESLDTGSEYLVVGSAHKMFNPIWASVSSTISLRRLPERVNGQPVADTAYGSTVDNQQVATETYAIRLGDIRDYFLKMSNFSWVSRGIFKIKVLPMIEELKNSADTFPTVPTAELVGQTSKGAHYPPGLGASNSYLRQMPSRASQAKEFTIGPEILSLRKQIEAALPARFRHLKKFATSPFCMIEMTDLAGNPIVLRPEHWQADRFNIGMLMSFVPGSERLTIWPMNYGSDRMGAINTAYYNGFNKALTITNFPEIATVNDEAAIALASTFNTRAQARSNADWSLQKSLAANENSFQNAGISSDLSSELAGIGRDADTAQTDLTNNTMQRRQGFNAISSTIMGGGMGLLTGGPAGALIGLGGGALNGLMGNMGNQIEMQSNTDALAIRNSASRAASGASTRASSQINRNNKRLADYAAKGDYQASIAMMNAAVRDTELTAPSVGAQAGGDMYNMAKGIYGVHFYVKMPDPGTIYRIGNYWLRYGYTMNIYQTPPRDLHCMTKFTYWKMLDVNIVSGDMPELYRQTIRGILEKGVTVWKNADDIGNVDMSSNKPLPNIRLEFQ